MAKGTSITHRHVVLLSSILAAACGSSAAEEGGVGDDAVDDSRSEITTANPAHPFFPSPPVTDENWDGSQYSVMIANGPGAGCSGQMINRRYAITAGHCFGPPYTVTDGRIYRSGPLRTVSGHLENSELIWSGTFNVFEAKQAACDSKRDFAILELVDGPQTIRTCQAEAQDCLDNLWWRPINGRIDLGGWSINPSLGTNQAKIFGWGLGKNSGPSDPGAGGIQRAGLLDLDHYEHAPGASGSCPDEVTAPVDPDGSGPRPPVQFEQTRLKFDAGLGFHVCQGDSGSPIMGDMGSGELITVGLNKAAANAADCAAGGVPGSTTGGAYHFSGSALGQLIFELERLKGHTTSGSVTSGRFRCNNFVGATQAGLVSYLRCDNDGSVISQWPSGWTTY